jgi:NAD-dependent deacetylase
MTPGDDLDRLAAWLHAADFVCAMTGAGVSAESGLATFRGPDGLWKGRDPAEVATPQAFAADPRGVWEFYRWRLLQAGRVEPNAGHVALASLPGLLRGFGLITQNVDRLHQRAGSRDVVELHGNIDEVRCVSCPHREPVRGRAPPDEPRCPRCGNWLRPCVVWFGEMLPEDAVRRASEWAQRCDVFMSLGTSGLVWPAAEFAHAARRGGAKVVEINLEPTPLTPQADLALAGKTGEILPKLVERLLGR